jgi:hypothetical protein
MSDGWTAKTSSSINFGSSDANDTGQNGKTFFAGSSNFTVKEIGVFEIGNSMAFMHILFVRIESEKSTIGMKPSSLDAKLLVNVTEPHGRDVAEQNRICRVLPHVSEYINGTDHSVKIDSSS